MTTRGWCPTLHEPMATGDGLLVRVKPRGGVLTAAAARLIAQESIAHGNGVVELTNRGNLQVRGLSPVGVRRFAAAMVAAGLASADPQAERRRNVIATPLAEVDPAVHPVTAAITAALEAALEQATALAMPAKFGFLVNGGGVLPVTARADVRVDVLTQHAEIVCDTETRIVALDRAVATAVDVAGVRSCSGWTTLTQPSPGGSGRLSVGAIAGIAVGAGLPFGNATAQVWSALADLAERFGDGKLRLTPSRAVLIAGLTESGGLADLGLIIDPDDPRLRVSACPGDPACASASVTTRDIAARLRPPPGTTIHVSGCDKGCAHPGPASLTLVGHGGRFDLVRDGHAGDVPARRGLSAAEVLAL